MEDRSDEILRRLAALERAVGIPPGDERSDEPATCAFHLDERRIVDLIVRLTTESVVRELEARMASGPPGPRHGPPPPPHDPHDHGHHHGSHHHGPHHHGPHGQHGPHGHHPGPHHHGPPEPPRRRAHRRSR
ncbi:MAG: hypothetical protein AB7S26_29435 [Sandaracinaceae bacterium]